eukprot:2714247-Amphidinium_carterae.1
MTQSLSIHCAFVCVRKLQWLHNATLYNGVGSRYNVPIAAIVSQTCRDSAINQRDTEGNAHYRNADDNNEYDSHQNYADNDGKNLAQ